MTTYNTRNPLGSQDPRDLFDNAQNIDHAANSRTSEEWTDRFGESRKTWHGIEMQAQIDIESAVSAATTQSQGFRDEAREARDDARASAAAIGPLAFYDTYALALANSSEERKLVEVSRDETADGARTRYWSEAGSLEFVVNLDQLRLDITRPLGIDPVGGFASVDDIAEYVGHATYARVNSSGEFGWYIVDPSDTTSLADRGFVVVDANNRRWKRVNADTVKPEMFGLTSTPVLTAAAFNAAADFCRASGAKLIKGATSYTLGGDVNLRSVRADFSGCEFIVNDGSLLTIGGNASTTINPEQVFGSIKKPRNWSFNPADYPTASVRVMGSKGQTIRISHVDRIQFYQSTNPTTFPTDASQAYSKFYMDFACVIDIDTDPAFNGGGTSDGPGSANQWFNENQFYLGRNVAFIMRGSYPHNNNRIHGGCYETSSALVDIQHGNKNWFTDVRFEGAVNVNFGVNTLGNIIDVVWFSSTAQGYQPPPAGGALVDNGQLNIVRDSRAPATASDCVFLVSSLDTVHDGQPGNYAFRSATKLAIRSVPRSTPRLVGESEYIDAQFGDYFFTELTSIAGQTSAYVLRIYLYDKYINLIAGNTANMDSGNFLSIFADRAEGRMNDLVQHHRFGILNKSVKFVRVEVLTTGITSEDNAIRIQLNRVSRMPGRSRETALTNTKVGRFDFAVTPPTKFVGRLGYLVAGATSDYRCVFYLETTLSAASSTNVITTAATTVTGVGAVANGDLVGVELDSGSTHWTTISGIGGGNITLTAQLPSAAAAGSRVYISRLSTR